MSRPVFRKVALDTLSSPEQLDELIRVPPARTWLALSAILVITGAALVWSVTASLPTTVPGSGVLIRAGGVHNVLAATSGRVHELLVTDESIVRKDQIVAVIEQPELRVRLQTEEEALARARADLEDLVARRQRELRIADAQRARERTVLDAQARQADSDLTYLAGELLSNRELEGRGLATRQSTMDIERRIEQTRVLAATVRNQVQQSLEAGRVASDHLAEELATARARLAESERQLAQLRRHADESRVVRSFHEGRVVALKVDPGSFVGVGTPIASVEVSSNRLEAVIFVDAARAKEVRPGMRVHLSPGDVRREEYGYMLGEVTHVSVYPATMEEEMRLFANEPLVRAMQDDGADMQVNVRLDLDPGTRSGFKWSSRTGPPTAIDSGTMCRAEIVTASEAPIRLVVPAVKRTLGLQ